MKQIYLLLAFTITFSALQSQDKDITFTKHIAPIIFTNCSPCHHPGTAAPFSLLSYEDVSKRAKMIDNVTQRRYMPPWKADHTYSSFANEKILTDSDLELIRLWVLHGAPKGKGKVKAPDFTNGSTIRTPDATLTMKLPYTIHNDNKENFVFFTIPFEYPEEFNVEAIEYISSNYKVVHHANFGIYAVDDPSIDIYSDTVGRNSSDFTYSNNYLAMTKNLIYYNGWVPGATPITFPDKVGFKMPKRGVIILTNHYSPSPIEVSEKSTLNIFFTKTSIERTVKTLSIGSGGAGKINPPLILFPNDVSKFLIQMEIVEPLSLLYVWPHMHLLGKSFKAYYATTSHDTVPLIRINKWDFNWQDAYKFKKLMKLPAGSVLTIEGEYDNTSNNPSNPFNPPQIIFSDGLMGTKNEMLSLILVYLTYKDGDENINIFEQTKL